MQIKQMYDIGVASLFANQLLGRSERKFRFESAENVLLLKIIQASR